MTQLRSLSSTQEPATAPESRPRRVPTWLLLGLAGALTVALQLEPAGGSGFSGPGPGQTVDEVFNVDSGVMLADRVLVGDLAGAARATGDLPDHPPLGRLWLGLTHELVSLVFPASQPISLSRARFGSALAFGGLIWLLSRTAARWWGTSAGIWTALILITQPRLFGHAHLAALESVLNLVYAAAVVYLAALGERDKPPSWKAVGVAGVLFGLVCLTKIQAILLPIPVLAWCVWRWRLAGFSRALVWGLVGGLVFFVGWPWLWNAPVGNLSNYLGHAAQRASIQVWYLGRSWDDQAVPWHYPWLIFAVTVSVWWLAAGLWTLREQFQSRERDPRVVLLFATALFPLVVFSLPGVAVYDGARLFLVSYPLWSLAAARSVSRLCHWACTRCHPAWNWVISGTILATLAAKLVVMSPCWLSDYNLLAGGLGGANRLGFQPTYWGDSLTPELLRETERLVPRGARLVILPNLHRFQLPALQREWPALADERWIVVPPDQWQQADYLLLFDRREYWPAELRDTPPRTWLATTARLGVRLAGLARLREE